MRQVVIENPILNSPYREPGRHWQFSAEGITNEAVEKRRVSSYFMPIARPRSKGKTDKAAKVSTVPNLWVPAVNNHGGFGRCNFIEIDDPSNAKTAIKGYLEEVTTP